MAFPTNTSVFPVNPQTDEITLDNLQTVDSDALKSTYAAEMASGVWAGARFASYLASLRLLFLNPSNGPVPIPSGLGVERWSSYAPQLAVDGGAYCHFVVGRTAGKVEDWRSGTVSLVNEGAHPIATAYNLADNDLSQVIGFYGRYRGLSFGDSSNATGHIHRSQGYSGISLVGLDTDPHSSTFSMLGRTGDGTTGGLFFSNSGNGINKNLSFLNFTIEYGGGAAGVGSSLWAIGASNVTEANYGDLYFEKINLRGISAVMGAFSGGIEFTLSIDNVGTSGQWAITVLGQSVTHDWSGGDSTTNVASDLSTKIDANIAGVHTSVSGKTITIRADLPANGTDWTPILPVVVSMPSGGGASTLKCTYVMKWGFRGEGAASYHLIDTGNPDGCFAGDKRGSANEHFSYVDGVNFGNDESHRTEYIRCFAQGTPVTGFQFTSRYADRLHPSSDTSVYDDSQALDANLNAGTYDVIIKDCVFRNCGGPSNGSTSSIINDAGHFGNIYVINADVLSNDASWPHGYPGNPVGGVLDPNGWNGAAFGAYCDNKTRECVETDAWDVIIKNQGTAGNWTVKLLDTWKLAITNVGTALSFTVTIQGQVATHAHGGGDTNASVATDLCNKINAFTGSPKPVTATVSGNAITLVGNVAGVDNTPVVVDTTGGAHTLTHLQDGSQTATHDTTGSPTSIAAALAATIDTWTGVYAFSFTGILTVVSDSKATPSALPTVGVPTNGNVTIAGASETGTRAHMLGRGFSMDPTFLASHSSDAGAELTLNAWGDPENGGATGGMTNQTDGQNNDGFGAGRTIKIIGGSWKILSPTAGSAMFKFRNVRRVHIYENFMFDIDGFGPLDNLVPFNLHYSGTHMLFAEDGPTSSNGDPATAGATVPAGCNVTTQQAVFKSEAGPVLVGTFRVPSQWAGWLNPLVKMGGGPGGTTQGRAALSTSDLDSWGAAFTLANYDAPAVVPGVLSP